MTYDDELDTRGLLCPLPVLKARKRLNGLDAGKVLKLCSDDPASRIDVPHFCTEAGHHLVSSEDQDGQFIFFIKRN